MAEHANPTILSKTVTHLVKLGSQKFPCCGRTPFTVPLRDSVTTDPEKANCGA